MANVTGALHHKTELEGATVSRSTITTTPEGYRVEALGFTTLTWATEGQARMDMLRIDAACQPLHEPEPTTGKRVLDRAVQLQVSRRKYAPKRA